MPERVAIAPILVEKDGPGVDLSSFPTGLAVEMSDPNPSLAYARNMVTLTYDLSGFENVELAFAAREFGDEPHWPKDEEGRAKDEGDEGALAWGPVADFDFDGVAMSDDLPSAPAGQAGGAGARVCAICRAPGRGSAKGKAPAEGRSWTD